MIIDLTTLSRFPRKFDFILEPSWWTHEGHAEPLQGLDGPMGVSLRIYKAGDKFVLNGLLSGGIKVLCDRCLEPYHRDLFIEFRLFFVLPSMEKTEAREIELTEEDLMVDFMATEQLDIDQIVREQIYLSLPMKSLCREDCAGLCPVCGTNRNLKSCRCLTQGGHPAFSVLQKLKITGE